MQEHEGRKWNHLLHFQEAGGGSVSEARSQEGIFRDQDIMQDLVTKKDGTNQDDFIYDRCQYYGGNQCIWNGN